MKKGKLYALMGLVVVIVGMAIYTVNFLYEKEQDSETFFGQAHRKWAMSY